MNCSPPTRTKASGRVAARRRGGLTGTERTMNHFRKLLVEQHHTHTEHRRSETSMTRKTFAALALTATAIGIASANPTVAVGADTSPVTNYSQNKPAYIENSVGYKCWEDDSCRKTAAGWITPYSPKTKATARKHARALLGPDGYMTCTPKKCTQMIDRNTHGQITFRYHPRLRQITYRLTAVYCLAGGLCERGR